ncbi:MAG: MFS transporter [Candidatus Omnitrophica bacterium]|nr:MFS transporter [Candidatus Omnitrophota bacterium]
MRASPQAAKFSWALYDLANSIFSMNIISLYFVLWLTIDKKCPELYYSLTLGGSLFLAAIFVPILGEISDRLKKRIPFLFGFTLGCVIFTACLGLIKGVGLALFLFFLANFCYQTCGVIYNSLLVQVSTPQTLGRTSGLGVSLGYLGSILGLFLVKPFLDLSTRQATFIPSAILFFIFALPAFIFIKDPPHPHPARMEIDIKNTCSRLFKGLSAIRQDRSLFKFLTAGFFSLNAVNTVIIFMSVYLKRVIYATDTEIIYFMSVSILFAIAGSFLFGYLTDRLGSRDSLNLAIKLWCLSIFLAIIAISKWMFWLIGPLVGICLGATWVSIRTMLIELVPKEKIGRMFGLFGLVARCSAILGPIFWGIIVWTFSDLGNLKYRLALFLVFLFMLTGYILFQKVADPRKVEA